MQYESSITICRISGFKQEIGGQRVLQTDAASEVLRAQRKLAAPGSRHGRQVNSWEPLEWVGPPTRGAVSVGLVAADRLGVERPRFAV